MIVCFRPGEAMERQLIFSINFLVLQRQEISGPQNKFQLCQVFCCRNTVAQLVERPSKDPVSATLLMWIESRL